MLKNKMVITIFLSICFFSSSFAQSSTKFGVGIALMDIQQLWETAISDGWNTTITFPIETSPNFRLEPEIGYNSATQENDNPTREQKVTDFRIGLGVFPQKTYEDFTLYYGVRVGYISQTQTSTISELNVDDEETTSGFFIAPALGGEHNFSNHFSIGGEAQLVYSSLDGERKDSDSKSNLSYFNTRALIFFRFYF